MITFPIAKINLGLNVVEKRADGYHNLQTVFFPVPLLDALDVQEMGAEFPSQYDCDLKVSNIHFENPLLWLLTYLLYTHKPMQIGNRIDELPMNELLGA